MLSSLQKEFLTSLLTRARARTGVGTWKPRQSFHSEQRSGAGPDERDPSLLAGAIDRLVMGRGWDRQVAMGTLIGRWPEVVGADVAANVEIETFELDPSGQAGVLVLRTSSTAWATQLKYMLAIVQERVDSEIGAGRVSEIIVKGPDAPSWSHGLRSVKGRGPRDTYG